MILTAKKKFNITLLLIYWTTLFILTHMPIPASVRQAHVSDKALHFLSYMVFTFLVQLSVNPDKKVNWKKASSWWTLAAIVLYSSLDEWLQSFVGRNAAIQDFLANLAGTIAAFVLLTMLRFHLASIVGAAIVIFSTVNISRVNLADVMPTVYTLFHFAGYAVFSFLWITLLRKKTFHPTSSVKWFFTTISLPLTLLIAVKLFSIILNRNIETINITVALIGIITTSIIFYIIRLSTDKSAKTE